MPRNERKYVLTSVIALEKGIWCAPVVREEEQIKISKWKYEEFEFMKRIPYEAVINLCGKFARVRLGNDS
jgi:hypothetical protein